MLGNAIAIAAQGYRNTKDKGGQPYILHCIRVMENVGGTDEELKCIAILHDTIEDCVCSEQFLRIHFTKRIADGVLALTHDRTIGYEKYIENLSENADAVKVKLADLKDNSDITRLKGLRDKDIKRIEKYHRAFIYLSSLSGKEK